MKLDERGFTDFYHFPVEETDAVMEHMEKFEFEACEFKNVRQFNAAWNKEVER
jgi:hypothetical protein